MVKSFLIPKLNEPKLAELINVLSAEYGIKVFVTNWKYQTASSLSNTVDSAMGQRDVIKGAMTDDETDDHQNKTDNPDLGNSTSNVTEKEKKFADAMHKVMLTNKWWYTTIPTSIVCSDFYTNMNFHTFYSFGFCDNGYVWVLMILPLAKMEKYDFHQRYIFIQCSLVLQADYTNFANI